MTLQDTIYLGVVGLLLAGLMLVVSRLANKGKIPAETARKSVHAGMGMICLSFPWIFSGPMSVVLLAIIASVGLLAVRHLPMLRKSIGTALHGVERKSSGELFFPIAVAAVFVLAADRKVFYLIPMLVLTVADALGAMVGTRYGQSKYIAWKGSKSIEGSFLFFLSAFLCCHLVLLLATSTPREACVWIALSVALLSTAIEGILGDGWDNLLMPLGVLLTLDQLDAYEVSTQKRAALIFFGIFSVLWVGRRWSFLNGGAMLAGLLYGAACLAWGGYIFLLGPIVMFALHLLVSRRLAPRRTFSHAADAIVFLAVPVIGILSLYHGGFISYEIAFALHTGIIASQSVMMHASLRRALGLVHMRVGFGMAKALCFILSGLVLMPTLGMGIAMLATCSMLPLLMNHVFKYDPDAGVEPRDTHIRRAFLASGVALVLLLVEFLLRYLGK